MNNYIPVTITIGIILIFGPTKKLLTLLKSTISNYRKYCSKINLREELYNLSPREFELWCGDFLKGKGYTGVTVSPPGPDGGVDIKCFYNEEEVYVECKRYYYKNNAPFKVDKDVVRKLVGAMEGNAIKHGMIITTGIATSGALEFIKTLPEEYTIDVFQGDTFDLVYEVESFDFSLIK